MAEDQALVGASPSAGSSRPSSDATAAEVPSIIKPQDDASEQQNPRRQRESLFDADWSKDARSFALHFGRYFVPSLVASAAVAVAAIAMWSGMTEYSQYTLALVREDWFLQYICGTLTAVIFFLLYLLDFFLPPHLPGTRFLLFQGDKHVGPGLVIVAVLAAWVAMVFSAAEYVWGPVLATTFLCPPLLAAVRLLLRLEKLGAEWTAKARDADYVKKLEVLRSLTRHERDVKVFYEAAGLALLLVGLGVLCAWTVGLFTAQEVDTSSWDARRREEWQTLRISPAFIAANYFFFCALCLVRVALSSRYTRTDEHRAHIVVKVSPEYQQVLRKQRVSIISVAGMRSFQGMSCSSQAEYLQQHTLYLRQLEIISGMMVALFCVLISSVYVLYMFADEGGAQKTLLSMIQANLVLAFATALAFVFVTFNRVVTAMGRELGQLPMVATARSAVKGDGMRAFGVFFIGPIFPLMVLLSMVNQLVRRCRGLDQMARPLDKHLEAVEEKEDGDVPDPVEDEHLGGGPRGHSTMHRILHSSARSSTTPTPMRLKLPEGRRRDVLTWRVHWFIYCMTKWNWCSVLEKVMVLGLCSVVYTVTPLLLNVLLSQMVSVLRPTHMVVIFIAIWLLGLVLFLLPPVPGAPIYAFAGILLAGKGEEEWGKPNGFWLGSAVCLGVCWFLKLSACAVQQKFIGERLGSLLVVQQAVGVHKPLVRAIEHVLRKPGLSFGKAIILMAGPDWPTSTLAGVLRLSILQCTIGTMPIIVYIAPLALTGSFYYKREQGYFWQSAADLMLLITGIETLVLWALMGWVIQSEMSKHSDLFSRPMARYVDLEWLEYRTGELRKLTSPSFGDVPLAVAGCFVAATAGIMVVGHFFYWKGALCFGSFSVTDDIETISVYGEPQSLVQPLGLVGLAATTACLALYGVFIGWRSVRATRLRREAAPQIDPQEAHWKELYLRAAAEAEAAAGDGGIDREPPDIDIEVLRERPEEERTGSKDSDVPPEIYHPSPNSPGDRPDDVPEAEADVLENTDPEASRPPEVSEMPSAGVEQQRSECRRKQQMTPGMSAKGVVARGQPMAKQRGSRPKLMTGVSRAIEKKTSEAEATVYGVETEPPVQEKRHSAALKRTQTWGGSGPGSTRDGGADDARMGAVPSRQGSHSPPTAKEKSRKMPKKASKQNPTR